jgi:hypothetical protein
LVVVEVVNHLLVLQAVLAAVVLAMLAQELLLVVHLLKQELAELDTVTLVVMVLTQMVVAVAVAVQVP